MIVAISKYVTSFSCLEFFPLDCKNILAPHRQNDISKTANSSFLVCSYFSANSAWVFSKSLLYTKILVTLKNTNILAFKCYSTAQNPSLMNTDSDINYKQEARVNTELSHSG